MLHSILLLYEFHKFASRVYYYLITVLSETVALHIKFHANDDSKHAFAHYKAYANAPQAKIRQEKNPQRM